MSCNVTDPVTEFSRALPVVLCGQDEGAWCHSVERPQHQEPAWCSKQAFVVVPMASVLFGDLDMKSVY